MIIDGKKIASELRSELKTKIAKLTEKPELVVILVGNNPASESYVKGKIKAAEEVGIKINNIRLPETISEAELIAEIEKQNKNDQVDGILVQLPLPVHIQKEKIINVIASEKDVDGFTDEAVAKLYQGLDTFMPCTPKGIIHLIETVTEIEGKKAVVFGRSNIVGMPVSKMLLDKNATVTTVHSKSKNIKTLTKDADIIVSAVGKPNTITKDLVSEKAIIIDVGMNRVDGKLCGDADYENLKDYVKAITPVPGGVGPMTIYMLLENTYKAYEKRREKK